MPNLNPCLHSVVSLSFLAALLTHLVFQTFKLVIIVPLLLRNAEYARKRLLSFKRLLEIFILLLYLVLLELLHKVCLLLSHLLCQLNFTLV
jgi:hypothetical protein